jgi:hypothetical protein
MIRDSDLLTAEHASGLKWHSSFLDAFGCVWKPLPFATPIVKLATSISKQLLSLISLRALFEEEAQLRQRVGLNRGTNSPS